jgi:hypothetical protein
MREIRRTLIWGRDFWSLPHFFFRSHPMGKMTVNGKTIDVPSCSSITVVGGKIYIDGTLYEGDVEPFKSCHIEIQGDVNQLKVERGDVTVTGNVKGNVDCGGSAQVQGITGAVGASGSVECGDVGGDVAAGGSVRCGKVGGSVRAGGSVRHS